MLLMMMMICFGEDDVDVNDDDEVDNDGVDADVEEDVDDDDDVVDRRWCRLTTAAGLAPERFSREEDLTIRDMDDVEESLAREAEPDERQAADHRRALPGIG